MAKIDKRLEKKKAKLEERITEMELALTESLTKKTSNVGEVSIGSIQSEILRLKKLLKELK